MKSSTSFCIALFALLNLATFASSYKNEHYFETCIAALSNFRNQQMALKEEQGDQFNFDNYFLSLKDKFFGEESEDAHGPHASCLDQKLVEGESKADKPITTLRQYAFENSSEQFHLLGTEVKESKYTISLGLVKNLLVVLRNHDEEMASKDKRKDWPKWRKAARKVNPARKIRAIRSRE